MRPGNSDLCGWVPDRLANVTGLKTGYLGNCSALPPPRPRILPTPLVPAPAPTVSAFSIPVVQVCCSGALHLGLVPDPAHPAKTTLSHPVLVQIGKKMQPGRHCLRNAFCTCRVLCASMAFSPLGNG